MTRDGIVTFLDRWIHLRMFEGRRTQFLVTVAFVLNVACYVDLPEGTTNFYKLAVQQCLILMIGTVAAKLDRLRSHDPNWRLAPRAEGAP